jgi:RHS repeat-associated protein
VSNENATLVGVYFDDVVITQTKNNIVQANEYYPFGWQTVNSWTRENVTGNNFLANGGTEFNTSTYVYDLDYRNYDPTLGRMNQVDPMADNYSSLTPYNFAFNDPVYWSDPAGDDPPSGASRATNMWDGLDAALAEMQWYNDGAGMGNSYGSMFINYGVGVPWGTRGTPVAEQIRNANSTWYSYEKIGSIKAGEGEATDKYDWVEHTKQLTGQVKSGNSPNGWRLPPQQDPDKNWIENEQARWRLLFNGNVLAFLDYYPKAQHIGFGGGAATSKGLQVALRGSKDITPVVYTVYKAVAKNGSVYWGMTKDFTQRVAQHGNRFVSITEEYVNIGSKAAARGIEQMKIDGAGGVKNLENAINSISVNNRNLVQYYQEAVRYFSNLPK